MEPVTYCVKKIFNRFFEYMKPVTSMIIQNTLIVNNIFRLFPTLVPCASNYSDN